MGDVGGFLIVFFLFWAIVCLVLAKSLGVACGGFWWGLFLGPLGVFVVLLFAIYQKLEDLPHQSPPPQVEDRSVEIAKWLDRIHTELRWWREERRKEDKRLPDRVDDL